jgi:hypothetical protein
MADLRITDEVDRDMVRDMGGPTEPQTPTPELDAETIELLKKYGFDHVPTADELRDFKARRQAEIREEVLFQADRRNWCEDGTRKVCANLRVQRPGQREDRKITVQVTYEVELTVTSYTDRGAVALALSSGYLPVEKNNRRLAQRNIEYVGLEVNGTPAEITPDMKRIEEEL